MGTRRHVSQIVRTAAVLWVVVVAGCGEGAGERRPAATDRAPAASRSPEAKSGSKAATQPWTQAQALQRLAGRRIRVERRSVRLDRTTLTCGGIGSPVARIRGEAAWTRFRCVQPTFPRGAFAGPDAVFVVEPRGDRAFTVTRARFTRY